MHGQPDCRLAGNGPLDSMPSVGRDLYVVSRLHGNGVVVTLESQTSYAAQEQNPFVGLLIVPEARGRGMPQ